MTSRRFQVIKDPETKIRNASPEELSYIAALIDGEGSIDIKSRQPRISVTMKSDEPLRLAKRYGHLWYVGTNKKYGSIYYSWYIQGRPLIDDFIDMLRDLSRVKKEQFKLLHEASEISKDREDGWKDEIKKIAEQLKDLHHKNPVATLEAASILDKRRPGWRGWVRRGTVIESEP